eukprot:1091598-Prymnesium_polylepis.1
MSHVARPLPVAYCCGRRRPHIAAHACRTSHAHCSSQLALRHASCLRRVPRFCVSRGAQR